MAHGSTRSSVGVRRISSSRTSALRRSSPVTVRFWDYLAVGRERETVARRGVDWKKPKQWIVAKNSCDVPEETAVIGRGECRVEFRFLAELNGGHRSERQPYVETEEDREENRQ